MSKKKFGASGLDKLFTSDEEFARTQAQPKTPQTCKTHKTHETQQTHTPPRTYAAPRQESTGVYRLNLKLNREFKEHLTAKSWENRVTITKYVNNLIEADMAKAKKPQSR